MAERVSNALWVKALFQAEDVRHVAVVHIIVSAQNCAKNVRLEPILTQKGLLCARCVLAADTGRGAMYLQHAVGRAHGGTSAFLEQLRVSAPIMVSTAMIPLGHSLLNKARPTFITLMDILDIIS